MTFFSQLQGLRAGSDCHCCLHGIIQPFAGLLLAPCPLLGVVYVQLLQQV